MTNTEKMNEKVVLEQLLSSDGYHDQRIVKSENGTFEPQHDYNGEWKSYCVVCDTAKEAMICLMKQPLVL